MIKLRWYTESEGGGSWFFAERKENGQKNLFETASNVTNRDLHGDGISSSRHEYGYLD